MTTVTTDTAISLRSVRKTFGKKVAVRGIDLEIPSGGLVGFIGPNGAGKTTTIRMIMAILFPDSGELSVLGRRSAVESKDRIGYLPEERGVYKKMKVGQFLRHMGRLKNADPKGLDNRIMEWLERVQLPGVWNKRCEELSKGMQQKVQFVSSVLHEPDLLILDEPFSGLDPVNMRLLRDLIREENQRGTTIIFSTHVMAQAQQICDHVVMIHNGEKVLDDTVRGLRDQYEPRAVFFEPIGGAFDHAAVAGLPGVRGVREIDGHAEAALAEGADAPALVAAIAAAVPVSRVELHRPTLEDIFIEIVQGGDRGGEDAEALRAALRAGAPGDAVEQAGEGVAS